MQRRFPSMLTYNPHFGHVSTHQWLWQDSSSEIYSWLSMEHVPYVIHELRSLKRVIPDLNKEFQRYEVEHIRVEDKSQRDVPAQLIIGLQKLFELAEGGEYAVVYQWKAPEEK